MNKVSQFELEHGHYCYWMPYLPNGEMHGKPEHFFVGIVVDSEPGYYVTDWDYGIDGELARAVVAKMNRDKLRLTDEQVDRIVAQSMGLGKLTDWARHTSEVSNA